MNDDNGTSRCTACYDCLNDPSKGMGNPVLSRMILCPQCGNKRCPKATHHALACSASNEANQPGSRYGGLPEAGAPPVPAPPAPPAPPARDWARPGVGSLTWRAVLDCKNAGTSIDIFARRVWDLGYTYFVHNGRVFSVYQCGTRGELAFVAVRRPDGSELLAEHLR